MACILRTLTMITAIDKPERNVWEVKLAAKDGTERILKIIYDSPEAREVIKKRLWVLAKELKIKILLFF